MRLIAGTDGGIEVLRWIEGERSAQRKVTARDEETATTVFRGDDGVYCGTASGKVFFSRDRGEEWVRMWVDPEERAVRSLTGTPGKDGPLYLGTEPAGLHVSRDRGFRWEEVERFGALEDEGAWTDYGEQAAHVQALALDPEEPRRIYVGVEVGGAYRSDDGGSSWVAADKGLHRDIHALAVDPRQASRVYAATGGGFYLSADQGRTWRETGPEEGCYCTALTLRRKAAAAQASSLLLATAGSPPGSWSEHEEGADAGLWESRDGGESWEKVELWAVLAHRNGIVALLEDPTEVGGYFVATAGGDLNHRSTEEAMWDKVYERLGRIHALEAV